MSTRGDGWNPYSIQQVLELLDGYDGEWWLAGGHALDVFAGRTTRQHGDIDVSVPRDDFDQLRRHFAGRLQLVVAQDGKLRALQDSDPDGDVHGLWGGDTSDGPWRIQVNLEPVERGEWIYRRDERVRRPFHDAVWRAGTLPYRNPAVGLLWKARDATRTDELDFTNVEPRLPPDERTWLAHAIAVAHPGSPWVARLAD